MADVAKLHKVVDYSLSIPDISDTPTRYKDVLKDSEAAWNQGTWFHAYRDEGGTLEPAGQVEVTEAGLISQIGEHQCRTAACIAGNTAVLFAPVGSLIYNDQIKLPGGSWQDIDNWATAELGLTEGEAIRLYRGGNSADDIREITRDITGE
jgi:hypothetical protein